MVDDARRAHDEQVYRIVAEDGCVLVSGPGVVMSLHPDAAVDASARMATAALEAARQAANRRP